MQTIDWFVVYCVLGYHSGYGSASGQQTAQSGQPQPPGLAVSGGGNNMPPSSVLSGLSGQSSAQAYHQLQSQHASRAGYPQSNDPLMSHKIHSQYPGYGSAGQALGVRGQYPTDPRYGIQHGMGDYSSAMSQASHLSALQSAGGGGGGAGVGGGGSGGPTTQPPMPTAYGQQSLMGQYAGQRMHTPGMTPTRQPPTGAPMHGMPSHYSSSYPSAPTQSGYHSHSSSSSDMWSGQGVPHMQPSSTYPGYPGSGGSGGAGPPGRGGPQSQYVSHSEYNAMHPNEQQRQYYPGGAGSGGGGGGGGSSGGSTQNQQSMTAHIPSDGSTLPYPTAPSQGPYSGSSASQQQQQQQQSTSSRGQHSGISGSVGPRQQYMGYNTPSLQSQPTSQQNQSQSSGASIPRYPQQYSGYPQAGSYGESSAQSRLSPYPLSQTVGPTGPNSPQFRAGFPGSAGSQLSSLSPRRPTTTPPAGSPMPPSSHTPDTHSRSSTAGSGSQPVVSHQSSFPISPGANHLSSPVQGMSPGSSVPSTPSSLQQLEQMVMPHLGGGVTGSASKASIPVSTNTSSSSSTSSYYGSVGPNTPSGGGGGGAGGAAPPSPQQQSSGQRQGPPPGMYSHYGPTSGTMASNQSQYPYHQQYQQNNTHWTGAQPNPIGSVVSSSSSSISSSSATSITNTHSMGASIGLQPQSSQTPTHQSSPTVASNSSSPNVSKGADTTNTGGQYNSYGSEMSGAVSSVNEQNFSQAFSRSTSSSTNSTPPSSSSSSSSQALQSGYPVNQSTGNTGSVSPYDSSAAAVIKAAQHKQQVQQHQQQTGQAAPNDTQQSQQTPQSQSQTSGGANTMASPTHMFDSIKSPNASTPRPMSDPSSSSSSSLGNDLQPTPQQSNQTPSDRMPNSQSVGAQQQQQQQQTPQMMVPGVGPVGPPPPQPPHPQSHHPYHQMMHHHHHQQQQHNHQQQAQHQSYPPQPPVMGNYQNSYDPMNYDPMTGDMSQSGPYGDHDSGMMYDAYGMEGMVPSQMGEYGGGHRDSGGDYGPIDPYSANFDDSFGEPPTKRKGKGRPKKDPNEPKKERKPRQPRAPRGSGRGRGRGKQNSLGDRMPPMPPQAMLGPPDYDPNAFGMPPENMDIYGHEMYGQPMPPSQQSALGPPLQQSQQMGSMPPQLGGPPPQPLPLPLPPSIQPQQQQQPVHHHQTQQQHVQQTPPPSQQTPPQLSETPPPSQQSPQTNNCQQSMQSMSSVSHQPIPTPLEPQPPQKESSIMSPQPSPLPPPQPPPAPPHRLMSPIPSVPLEQPPIPAIIEKPLESEQNLYDENFLEQTTISDNNPMNDTTMISMTATEEDENSVPALAVPSESDMYTCSPPRQVSPSPPPITDDVIPEPKMDSYDFAAAEEQQQSASVTVASTPGVKEPKTTKKATKKRKPKKESAIEPEVETGGDTTLDGEPKPPKAKKAKKRKKKQSEEEVVPEVVIEPPAEEILDESTKVSQTTDLDDATQESSLCDSSAMESSTGKSSAKKEKSKRDSKSRSKPKLKNRSPKKKLPKLALKFNKNKKKRRLGGPGSPDHSDLERTPPPSPDDTETGIQKRRSARNTKRQKYTDDIELDLSEDDDSTKKDLMGGVGGILTPLLDSNGKPIGDGNVLSVVTNINEDTMVVEKILTSRLAQRELEDDNNENLETDPNFKPQTVEVEEFFVKYKNLSYFHCEWRTEEELEKGDRRIGQKIKRFRQKKDTLNMFDFLDEEPYNPDYIEVDRILDVNEIEEYIEPTVELKAIESVVQTKSESKDEIESKDETESQTNDSQTIETDKTEPNSAESSVVPNDSEKTEADISDTNDTKDKSEDSVEKMTTEDNEDNDDIVTKNEDKPSDTDTIETKNEIIDKHETKDESMEATTIAVSTEVSETDKTKDESTEEDEKPKAGPVETRKVKHYLVKWRALPYEDSTWELEDDLDPIKVEQFWRFRKPPPKSEWKPKRRPKASDWKKLEESPVYKAGNTLREYQLEGVNWLSYCWYNG